MKITEVENILRNLEKVNLNKISYIELVTLLREKNSELNNFSMSFSDACCLAKCLKYKRE